MQTMRFTHEVQPGERDPNGNFHGAVFSVVFSDYRYKMIESLGIGVEWFKGRDLMLFGKRHEFEFGRAPIGPNDGMVVFELFLEKLEKDSGELVFGCRAYRASDGALTGWGSAVTIIAAKVSGKYKKAPIPDEVHEKLAQYLLNEKT